MSDTAYNDLMARIEQLEASVQNLQAAVQAGGAGAPAGGAPGGTPGNVPNTGAGAGAGGGAGRFRDFFYMPSDPIGLGLSVGGNIANAVFKSKAAKQIARGNAPQHLAAALSTPQSQRIFGDPLGSMAKISADAGQAKATTSLATGEAIQNSANDVANFISSINTMRRLLGGDALSAMSLHAMNNLIRGVTGGRR
jgi:hypothetical protein